MGDWTNGGPLGTCYAVTSNGWMDTPAFLDWFTNLFIPSLPEERPILLILDGHSSHLSYRVRVLAIEHKITMLKLPSHLTHILQPLDVSVFKPMKAVWDREASDFTRRNKRPIGKKDFPSLIKKVWQAYKPDHGKNGFKKAGIIPYNKDAISRDTLKYSELHSSSTSAAVTTGTMLQSTSLNQSTSDQLQNATSICTRTCTTPVPALVTPQVASSVIEVSSQQTLDQDNTSPTNISSSTLSSAQPSPESSSFTDWSMCMTNYSTHTCSNHTSGDVQSRSESVSSEGELRNFFGQLLLPSITGTTSQSQATPRHRLLGAGESLTSEEAMAKLRHVQAEEKKKKELEKQARKEKREERK